MLADTIDSREITSKEVDFSHLYFRVIHGELPESIPVLNTSSRYIFIGFLLSGLLHVCALIFYWEQDVAPVMQTEHRLTVQLQTKPRSAKPTGIETPQEITSRTETVVSETSSVPSASPDVRVTSKMRSIDTTQQKPEKTEEKTVRVQHLTAAELREISSQKKAAKDAPATGIAANVFNPVLRKRLHEESNKPVLQRSDEGPKTHVDPAGATIVDLGGGKCLRSSVPKAGEVQNWYMTSCGGKSESEQIMERVNQAVNEKLMLD